MTKHIVSQVSLVVSHATGVDVTIDEDVTAAGDGSGNSKEAEDKFADLGVGVLLNWGLDTPLGMTPGHWLCSASKDIVDRFFQQAPRRFEAPDFEPNSICNLLANCGIRYLVFTAKHMSGFCFFHSETTRLTTEFTPFSRDAHRELLDAARFYGLGTGTYYCPLDLHFLHGKGIKQLHFMHPTVDPRSVPALHDLNLKQIEELATRYGPCDYWFLDGPPEGLRELIWKVQPSAMVTRGQIATPEQTIPLNAIPSPWEACFTIGTQWNYKPTNEIYKTGRELIETVIQLRSKGGNALIGISLDHRGRIPFEQERLLQELGLFLFFNGEAIHDTRQWTVPFDGTYYYTFSQKRNAVYAFVPSNEVPYAKRGSVLLRGVRASEHSHVEIVGQDGLTLQHHPNLNPAATWKNTNEGLLVECTRCYRPYDIQVEMNWPNPFSIRVTHPVRP